jgi:leucyl aminopeptidase
LRQAALAIHRANYLYTATKKPQDDAPAPLEMASFQADGKFQLQIDQAGGIARGYDKARELGDLPPNIATPDYLVQEARKIADEFDTVALDILDEEDGQAGMNALLNCLARQRRQHSDRAEILGGIRVSADRPRWQGHRVDSGTFPQVP